MEVETGPEFGKKVEKKENEKIEEQIRSHLKYRKGIEESTLSSTRERLGFSPEPSELEMHRKMENFTYDWYQEANRQLESRERGEQIHSILNLPTREEERAEKEIDMLSEMFARQKKPEKDTEEYIENQKKLLKGEIKFCRGTRENWIKKLEKSPKTEEISKLRKKLEESEEKNRSRS